MVAQMYFLQMAHGIENYQYYHVLSGACMPLKTQKEIHEFFDKNTLYKPKEDKVFSDLGADFNKYFTGLF